MGAHTFWRGRVTNKSKKPVWVIWDENNGSWNGRPLAPGRKTPDKIDVDGVSAFYAGQKIFKEPKVWGDDIPTDQWWWLQGGAEVTIVDRPGGGQTLKRDLGVAKAVELELVTESQVATFGVDWDSNIDIHWGEKA